MFVILALLSACANETNDAPINGFDFTEEEAIDLSGEPGIENSDDDTGKLDTVEGVDVSEKEVANAEEMVFDEVEAFDLQGEQKGLFPPQGITSWLFNHDDVIITCPPEGSMVVSGPESETLKIALGAEGASLVISELYAGYEVFYVLEYADVGGSKYYGQFTNPEEGIETYYEILFTSVGEGATADYLIGSLRSEFEVCVITRSFDGYLLE